MMMIFTQEKKKKRQGKSWLHDLIVMKIFTLVIVCAKRVMQRETRKQDAASTKCRPDCGAPGTVGTHNGTAILEGKQVVLTKLSTLLAYDPAVTLLGVHTSEMIS